MSDIPQDCLDIDEQVSRIERRRRTPGSSAPR